MRIWQLAIVSVVALAVAACEQKPQQPTAHTETTPPPAAMEKPAPVSTDAYATDPYASDSTAAMPRDTHVTQKPAAGGAKESTLIPGKGGRSHVVEKGDTLYSLARKYYHDQKRWKDIWDANRSVIPDKDHLKVGTKLVIP
jgi:nucleoid-associated protein YgaU